ncbi:MAG: hypothetical protein JWQ78_1784 [Sediminibacterium sp.]|nr:hypothetical protein [Sediminibacterium sp.]
MKLIRLAVFSIVILFVLATLLGALLPSTVLVSRAVSIAAPKDSVMRYATDINQWRSWMQGMDNPIVKIHSASQADLGGTSVHITGITDSTVISSWTGRNGDAQISTLRLIRTDSLQKLTIVQWQFVQQLKWYPWEKLGSIMNDKILGTMMEKNLNSLKSLAEHK